MALTRGPLIQRNLTPTTTFKKSREVVTRPSVAGDRRIVAPNPPVVDFSSLSTENLSDLTSTQIPQLRISITKLTKIAKDLGTLPRDASPLKKKLLFQRKCQIQLTIHVPQYRVPLDSTNVLYSDYRNATFKLTQGAGPIFGVVELDTPFEMERSKLLVVVNANEPNWKYSMANLYRLDFTLRFLDRANLDEFLPYMFDHSTKPSSQTHAVFGMTISSDLQSGTKSVPFMYRSNQSRRETGWEMLVDCQWLQTTKSCLQLAQADIPKTPTNLRVDAAKFVVEGQNSGVVAAPNFECAFCSPQKSQGSIEGLDSHLKARHNHLGFTKRKIATGDGGCTVEFTITSVRDKILGGGYIATPPDSDSTPPQNSSFGDSSWVENGKWQDSKELINSVIVESERRKINQGLTLPQKIATRLQTPGTQTERHRDSENRRDSPMNSSAVATSQKVGVIHMHSSPTGSNRLADESRVYSSPKNALSLEKDFRDKTSDEDPSVIVPGSSHRIGAYANFGPAAVADMSRASESKLTIQNIGNAREPPQKSGPNDLLRASSSLHSISSMRSDFRSALLSANDKMAVDEKTRPKSGHTTVPKSVRIDHASKGSEVNIYRTPIHQSHTKNAETESASSLNSGIHSHTKKGHNGHHTSPKSDAYRALNKSSNFSQSAAHSPVNIAPQPNRQSMGFSPRPSTHDLASSSADRVGPSVDQKNLILPHNIHASSSRSLPIASKDIPSTQANHQSQSHLKPTVPETVAHVKSAKDNDYTASLSLTGPSHTIRDDSEVLRTAHDLGKELPRATRRSYPVPAAPDGVTLFRTSTKQALVEGECVSESEDEVDESWAQRRHHETIDNNTEATAAEKAFMKRWDVHFAKEQLSGNTRAAVGLLRFTAVNRTWLTSNYGMLKEYSLKLGTWLEDKLILWQDVDRCMTLLKHEHTRSSNSESRAKMAAETTGSIVSFFESHKKRSPVWLSACRCGTPINIAEMPIVVSCSNYACKSPDHHLSCVGLTKRPESWYCSSCKAMVG